MCHCYVPFRGVIDLMIFLCFPLRFATSQAKMAGGRIYFPQHVSGSVLGFCPHVCKNLWSLEPGAYQVGDDWGFEFLFVEA
jgi:hypothetical protein